MNLGKDPYFPEIGVSVWACKYHAVSTPKYSVSQIVGYLKEHSGLMIVGRHADLKDKYGNRHFRAAGHCVSTAGIQEQVL